MTQIERRVAPFWRGLNDHSDSWTENQLLAAARGRPIPAPDEIPLDDQYGSFGKQESPKASPKNFNNLTVPISSRSQSFNSDSSSNLSPANLTFPSPAPNFPPAASSSGSALFRGRAKTLASLTTTSKNPQIEMQPREMSLPKDPFISGQPIEAYLYKDAEECPICFLFYPPYLNKTRCCDQSICSECFVQIKRPDPHPPEHADPKDQPSSTHENSEAEEADRDDILVSEPAACPFCVQPDFGVTYDPPSFRRGLTYANQTGGLPLANVSPAMSSSSSLVSAISSGGQLSPTISARRRTASISATSHTVITTDRVRPDWHQKLASARAHAARRSAAATALHTAAYLMSNRSHETDGRGIASFGRRGILRRATGGDSSTVVASPSHLNMLALMSERYASSSATRAETDNVSEGGLRTLTQPRTSSRRSRMDDLDDMMMMEAIRLSLASEEERRRREEKDAKKEAKKKEKESKKAEKVARKTGVYQTSANHSSHKFENISSDPAPPEHHDSFSTFQKGKGVQQMHTDESPKLSSNDNLSPFHAKVSPTATTPADPTQGYVGHARPQPQLGDVLASPTPYHSNTYRPSHLRNLSNISSSGSSIDDPALFLSKSDLQISNSSLEGSSNAGGVGIQPSALGQETLLSNTPPGGGAGLEPMFNFRSLAAMVGDDEKTENSAYIEHKEDTADDVTHRLYSRGESSKPPSLELETDAMTNKKAVAEALNHEEAVGLVGNNLRDVSESKNAPILKDTPDSELSNELSNLKAVEASIVNSPEAISGCRG